MARVHGKNLNFSFNAIALESDLNQVVMTATVPEADITAFADIYQNFLAGKKNVTLELSGLYDPAAALIDATLFAAIGAGPLSTILQPGGDTTGEYKCTSSGLTGTLLREYAISLPVGGKGSIRATLQNSGATVRT